jgi:hypothetical protein
MPSACLTRFFANANILLDDGVFRLMAAALARRLRNAAGIVV